MLFKNELVAYQHLIFNVYEEKTIVAPDSPVHWWAWLRIVEYRTQTHKSATQEKPDSSNTGGLRKITQHEKIYSAIQFSSMSLLTL